jgi:CPA1 family monovalent cation:H+ antiporter
MRGIVTLAAALALPAGGAGAPGFPHRDLLVFAAFSVVLGTLVIQGLTLRPLINALQLEDDGSLEREVRLARAEALRAALAAAPELPGDELSALLRRRYEVLLRRAQADLEVTEAVTQFTRPPIDVGGEIVRTATAAARRRLVALRADGTIGDTAFQRIEQELDREELNVP